MQNKYITSSALCFCGLWCFTFLLAGLLCGTVFGKGQQPHWAGKTSPPGQILPFHVIIISTFMFYFFPYDFPFNGWSHTILIYIFNYKKWAISFIWAFSPIPSTFIYIRWSWVCWSSGPRPTVLRKWCFWMSWRKSWMSSNPQNLLKLWSPCLDNWPSVYQVHTFRYDKILTKPECDLLSCLCLRYCVRWQ